MAQFGAILIAGLVLAAPPLEPPKTSSTLADIGPAPAVALTDASGKPFSLEALHGQAVVVSFIYTTCSGSCPATTLHLARVRAALEKEGLWGKRVQFVSITLDPARDTPEALATYARNFGVNHDAWHFLTGPPHRVREVIKAWGMWAKVSPSGILDHPSRIFLVDPRGRQREIYNLDTLTPRIVVQDVQSVLADEDVSRQQP